MLKTLLLVMLFASGISSSILSPQNITMIIYKDGTATIKDVRKISYDAGVSTINFTDVASTLRPNTVLITPINSTGKVRILERSFQTPNQGKYGTLKNYINKTIAFDTPTGIPRTKVGKLLAYGQDYIKIQNPYGGIQIYDVASSIKLPPLPDAPVSSPTISFVAYSRQPTTTATEVIYSATGLTWLPNYVIVLSEDQKTASVSGTITVDNNSGKNYTDLNLIIMSNAFIGSAKEPQIVQDPYFSSFSSRPLYDHQMFSLIYPISLNDLSDKQLEFFKTAEEVPVSKNYTLIFVAGSRPVSGLGFASQYSINNTRDNNLGMPMPTGQLQVFKKNSRLQSLELIQDTNGSYGVDFPIKFPTFVETKLQAKVIIVDRATNVSTNNRNNISQRTVAQTPSSSRRDPVAYSTIKKLNITNSNDAPVFLKVGLKPNAIKNFRVSYGDNYHGLKWDKNYEIEVVVPNNANTTVIEWLEQGIDPRDN